MIELYNLGLTDSNIKEIIQVCPNIVELTNEEIINNINILKDIGCSNNQIKNIILSNPFYLDRLLEDITSLIVKLVELRITNITLLFSNNPLLLNKDAYEIDKYISSQILAGKKIENIVDEFESNPYIIDEI